jgi:hypothetical protein
MKSEAFTLDDLAAAVAESSRPTVDVVPPGWFTIRQVTDVCRQRGYAAVDSRHARRIVANMTEGKPSKLFRVQNGQRGVYPIRHYYFRKGK